MNDGTWGRKTTEPTRFSRFIGDPVNTNAGAVAFLFQSIAFLVTVLNKNISVNKSAASLALSQTFVQCQNKNNKGKKYIPEDPSDEIYNYFTACNSYTTKENAALFFLYFILYWLVIHFCKRSIEFITFNKIQLYRDKKAYQPIRNRSKRYKSSKRKVTKKSVKRRITKKSH
tara:strand:+ start:7434 stop:7949 length:516 start_codon:yes stop_codon:yes gene_type:complete